MHARATWSLITSRLRHFLLEEHFHDLYDERARVLVSMNVMDSLSLTRE